MEGAKRALEANEVELPPTRFPSKGVYDRVGLFFCDECDTVGLSAVTVAEAALFSWSKLTSVGRNQNEYGNGGYCRFLLQRCARKTPRSPEWRKAHQLFQKMKRGGGYKNRFGKRQLLNGGRALRECDWHWTESQRTPCITRLLE